MKTYLVSIGIFLLCNISHTGNFYECVPKKALPGYSAKDFEALIFEPLAGNKIAISRTIPMGDDEVYMDEQFLNVKPARCHVPGKGGKKFYSAGFVHNSTNGYRVNAAVFKDNPPLSFELSYVLDKPGHTRHCIPAIYNCRRS